MTNNIFKKYVKKLIMYILEPIVERTNKSKNEIVLLSTDVNSLQTIVERLQESYCSLQGELLKANNEFQDFKNNELREINQRISVLINNFADFHNSVNIIITKQNDLEQKQFDLASHLESIDNNFKDVCQVLSKFQEENNAREIRTLEEFKKLENKLLKQILMGRSGMVKNGGNIDQTNFKPAKNLTIEECHKRLKEIVPETFKQWQKLFEVNMKEYEDLPTDSCSVRGHEMAENFKKFIIPYLRGRVLDIGCGPQPVPSYLEGYPVNLISGIDPIPEGEPHLFEFVNGVSEFLPWEDESFDVVLTATSLDHVLLLDRTLDEIKRVLTSDGVYITWVSFTKGADVYNPYQEHLKPIDRFHLFHFDKEWFEKELSRNFDILEVMHLDDPIASSFYSFTAKK